jgi:hypothetical protein
MFDDLAPLRELTGLVELLEHYAELEQGNRHAWHNRSGEQDPRTLSRLYGELIAGGWLEQNTGQTSGGCYRITPAGLRVLRELAEVEE